MRYSTPVFFVKEGKKQYDPDTGVWSSEENVRTRKYANITHMGEDRQQAVYGDVKSDRSVVRLHRAYTKEYDYIEINGEKYTVDMERCPSDRKSLVVIKNG